MRIGITYDLKADSPSHPNLPDDFQEEFDSPVTIDAIAAALRALDHEVVKLGDGKELLQRLLNDPPDFVFNIAEGEGVGRSREARVPAVLEMLGIPYTGSDPLTLAVTLDKDCAKRLVKSAGVMVPEDTMFYADDDLRELSSRQSLPYTAIVKPAWEGSSKGIRGDCVSNKGKEVAAMVEALRRDHQQPVLVEEYIEGEEITVGIVGNDPPCVMGAMQVLPREQKGAFVYSLEVKRDFRRQVQYECPPQLPAGQAASVERAALTAYRVLGCRDVARVDFRLRDGVPYFLELNPLPGVNPESSDLVILAQLAGWTYGQLIQSILQSAIDRQKN